MVPWKKEIFNLLFKLELYQNESKKNKNIVSKTLYVVFLQHKDCFCLKSQFYQQIIQKNLEWHKFFNISKFYR